MSTISGDGEKVVKFDFDKVEDTIRVLNSTCVVLKEQKDLLVGHLNSISPSASDLMDSFNAYNAVWSGQSADTFCNNLWECIGAFGGEITRYGDNISALEKIRDAYSEKKSEVHQSGTHLLDGVSCSLRQPISTGPTTADISNNERDIMGSYASKLCILIGRVQELISGATNPDIIYAWQDRVNGSLDWAPGLGFNICNAWQDGDSEALKSALQLVMDYLNQMAKICNRIQYVEKVGETFK